MLKTILPAVACILLVHNAFAQDIAAVAAGPLDYQVPGNAKFNFTLENKGSGSVNNCTVQWQLDNGPVQTVAKNASHIWWSNKLGIIRDAAFTVNLPAAGTYQLKAWIKVTNPADNNAANDTVKQTIKVFASLPKKNVVLEVFKHQGCGPCYPAAMYLNDFVSKDPAYAIVQIYNGPTDVLFNKEGADVDAQYGGFPHPMVLYDRFKFPFKSDWGHTFTNTATGDTIREYGERTLYYEPVLVWFKSTSYNESTRELKVKLAANFFADYSGDHRFNLYVTEDDVKAFQSAAPDPNNYYHKRVLRAMVGGSWGQQGSLPATIKAGDYHEYEFTYTIPAGYNTSKLRLVGMVQAYNADDKKRHMLNSDHKTFQQAVAVQDMEQAATVRVYPNPATDKLAIEVDKAKAYTATLVDMAGRICRAVQSTGNTTIDIQALAPGSYLLHIDDGRVVHTQTIIKE